MAIFLFLILLHFQIPRKRRMKRRTMKKKTMKMKEAMKKKKNCRRRKAQEAAVKAISLFICPKFQVAICDVPYFVFF